VLRIRGSGSRLFGISGPGLRPWFLMPEDQNNEVFKTSGYLKIQNSFLTKNYSPEANFATKAAVLAVSITALALEVLRLHNLEHTSRLATRLRLPL
jgi:hypothetical protein